MTDGRLSVNEVRGTGTANLLLGSIRGGKVMLQWKPWQQKQRHLLSKWQKEIRQGAPGMLKTKGTKSIDNRLQENTLS